MHVKAERDFAFLYLLRMSNLNEKTFISVQAAAFAVDLSSADAPLDENWIHRFNEFCSRHVEALEHWQDKDGRSLFEYHYDYLTKAFFRDWRLETFQGLVTRRILSVQNDAGFTLLHWICFQIEHPSAADIVSLFLRLSPEAAKLQSRPVGITPLKLACSDINASLKVIELLVEAHPEAVYTVDRYGDTPLHDACRHASIDCIRFLTLQAPHVSLLRNNVGELSSDKSKRRKIAIVKFMTSVTKAATGAATNHFKYTHKVFLPEICRRIAAFLIDEVVLFKMLFSNNEQVQLFLQSNGMKERIKEVVRAVIDNGD